MQLYSYHFIVAIQVILVFEIVFSIPVIFWIESIRGRAGGGFGWIVKAGGWGAIEELKHTFGLNEQYCTFSM